VNSEVLLAGTKRLLITIAVPANKAVCDASYDVVNMSK